MIGFSIFITAVIIVAVIAFVSEVAGLVHITKVLNPLVAWLILVMALACATLLIAELWT